MNFLQAKKYYHQSRILKHAKTTYSQLCKAFKKHIKTIEDWKALEPEENQELESIEGLFPKKRWEILKLKMK